MTPPVFERIRASFILADKNDSEVIIADLGEGHSTSVTDDVEAVVDLLQSSLPGGIGERRLFYRDTGRVFTEIMLKNGEFFEFAPCTEEQQAEFSTRLDWLLLP